MCTMARGSHRRGVRKGDRRQLLARAAVLASALWACAAAAGVPEPRTGETRVETLEALSPLAVRDELTRRLLSPLLRLEYDAAVAAGQLRVAEHSLRAGEAQFDVFVPHAPADVAYGVVVFVPPGERFSMPPGWSEVLARERLILVAARRSGNAHDVLARRVPLALHGYGQVAAHHAIDPRRVYVAGFSGGARVAQLLAFGYPDVFRGALLFAGSDPFGEAAAAPPPEPLMALAQARSRIVFSTGTADVANVAIDGRARRSMAQLCVRNLDQVDQPRLGHALPRAAGFGRALRALLRPPAPGTDAGCSAALQARIGSVLRAVERLAAAGRREEARARLLRLDAHYGGLAAPRSVEAMRRLERTGEAAAPGPRAATQTLENAR